MVSDQITSVQELRDLVESFVEERRWRQFHTPKNLSMSVAIEAAELMELFQWSEGSQAPGEKQLSRVREELADVVIYCLALTNALDIDLSLAIRKKMAANALKYPAERFRGTYE